MVQVVYKKRRVRTVLQPSKQRVSAPAPEAYANREPKMRSLHLKQFGISGEKSEQLARMQVELDALRRKSEKKD